MIVTEITLSGILVVIGKWSRGQSLSAKYALSAGILVLILLIIGEINDKLADAFGAVILCTCVLEYAPDLQKLLSGTTAVNTPADNRQYSGGTGGNIA